MAYNIIIWTTIWTQGMGIPTLPAQTTSVYIIFPLGQLYSMPTAFYQHKYLGQTPPVLQYSEVSIAI